MKSTILFLNAGYNPAVSFASTQFAFPIPAFSKIVFLLSDVSSNVSAATSIETDPSYSPKFPKTTIYSNVVSAVPVTLVID